MRVLYLAELLTDGGTAKHLAELLPMLAERGVDPVVWSRGKQGRYSQQLRASGVRVEQQPRLASSLVRQLRSTNFDLVHSYLYGAHLADAVACSMRGFRYVKSTRNCGHWNDGSLRTMAKVALRTRLVQHHVANSQGVADYLVAKEEVSRERITVIHNGMHDKASEASALTRADLGFNEDDFVIASIAWLKPRKHLHFLIRCHAELRQRGSTLKLMLVGDGPEETSLRTLASDLGIADDCRFVGRQAASHAFLRLADVSVSASPDEGMSNSLIESLMLGVPVVACREAAGNPDIVDHGRTGFLYSHGSVAQYVNAIEELRDRPELLRDMRSQSRDRFLAQFTMTAQVAGFQQLYDRVLTAAH